jgi:hypothetical protein
MHGIIDPQASSQDHDETQDSLYCRTHSPLVGTMMTSSCGTCSKNSRATVPCPLAYHTKLPTERRKINNNFSEDSHGSAIKQTQVHIVMYQRKPSSGSYYEVFQKVTLKIVIGELKRHLMMRGSLNGWINVAPVSSPTRVAVRSLALYVGSHIVLTPS